MTRLDWEGQNRKELAGPVDPDLKMLNDAAKHSKKRAQQKKYRQRKISRAIKAKSERPAFGRGVLAGRIRERQLIIDILEAYGHKDAAQQVSKLTPIKTPW
jgi:hypothetical protein